MANLCRLQEGTFRPAEPGVTKGWAPPSPKTLSNQADTGCPGTGMSCSPGGGGERKGVQVGRQVRGHIQPSFSRLASRHAPNRGLDDEPPPPCLGDGQAFGPMYLLCSYSPGPSSSWSAGWAWPPGARPQATPQNTQPTCCSQEMGAAEAPGPGIPTSALLHGLTFQAGQLFQPHTGPLPFHHRGAAGWGLPRASSSDSREPGVKIPDRKRLCSETRAPELPWR